ncbi:radical SAM protein [Methylicorpusculum sp.]|uniref:radical SAM protein n=1 Tax=Methylicorpusculum sp. TaxID=2713644 RepID=UPI00273064C2|nr:radical SAM protein [Methylicorpusculum sp.]MDP2180766.1 radical SAM protein [Methylicorpusculum sp.]MDP3529318.1 radical SAM protein [Methylicorpusculum sp.]MDZ4149971.1 radical SAM protein [Methylicorpusculum sp.]
MSSSLTTTDHNRNAAGLTYVYPVLSRRAGGVSIGINFNINNACNWRCIYCQVPDLSLGAAPDVDFELLEKELRFFIKDVLSGDFFDRFNVDLPSRQIKDIAISGNGEPTSLRHFDQAVRLIGSIAKEMGVFPGAKFVLITNGSLMHHSSVQRGLRILNEFGGEVWFKLDSATDAGRKLVNNAGLSIDKTAENLHISAQLCATKIQTCLIDYRGTGLSEEEKNAYIEFLSRYKNITGLKGIMLYGLARPSLQPEAVDLKPLPAQVINNFAESLRALGFDVSVNV